MPVPEIDRAGQFGPSVADAGHCVGLGRRLDLGFRINQIFCRMLGDSEMEQGESIANSPASRREICRFSRLVAKDQQSFEKGAPGWFRKFRIIRIPENRGPLPG